MVKKTELAGFVSESGELAVYPFINTSCRNRCPRCLHSKHVNIQPGGRANSCGGLMQPAGLTRRSGKDYQIIHRCKRCGETRINVIARDPGQADGPDRWISLSAMI
ncbi:TPA: RNHCP domain-containing protein [Candidatus Latescibacteria bacterium]|nr:RNHCP domain-containing protein [Candidatus Latescibacterota bacterium]